MGPKEAKLNLDAAEDARKLQLNELTEWRLTVYENAGMTIGLVRKYYWFVCPKNS